MTSDFTAPRAATLARMAGYGLLLVFLISLVSVFLPPPFLDPQRLLAALVEVLERSTVPLVAVFLLFWGFSGRSRPALWECRLAGLLRPLLLLTAVVYLATTISLGLIAQRLVDNGIAATDDQLRRSQAELQRARDLVAEIPDEATLKAWLGAQPALQRALAELPEDAGEPAGVDETRQRINRLLTISEANLQRDALTAKAELSGRIWARAARFGLTALVYALYFLGARLVWPRSLQDTRQRAWKQRSKAASQQS